MRKNFIYCNTPFKNQENLMCRDLRCDSEDGWQCEQCLQAEAIVFSLEAIVISLEVEKTVKARVLHFLQGRVVAIETPRRHPVLEEE
jgi:hypothetical protein